MGPDGAVQSHQGMKFTANAPLPQPALVLDTSHTRRINNSFPFQKCVFQYRKVTLFIARRGSPPLGPINIYVKPGRKYAGNLIRL